MKQPISDNTYFSIQAWMVTKLNLKGAERDVYAIIYGYSQDNDSDFHGSLDYISQLTGYSKNSICTALKSLTDSGLITKTEKIVNNIKYCRYRTSNLYAVQVTCTENEKSVQVACINNNNSHTNNNKNTNILSKDSILSGPGTTFTFGTKQTQPKQSMWNKCVSYIDDFTSDKTLRSKLIAALTLFLDNSKESGIAFYTNNFKGKLNALQKLSEDVNIQIQIVQQTLDNGWNGFYEIKQNNNRKTNNFAEDVEHLTGGLNERAKKGGIKSGQKF